MSTQSRRVQSTWPWYLAMLVVAGLCAGIISAQFLAESLAALGIPDPGALTTFGLPFLRATAWILAAIGVGSFLVTAFLLPPQVPAGDSNHSDSESAKASDDITAHDATADSSNTVDSSTTEPTPNEGLAHARLTVDGHLAARTGAWSMLTLTVVALAMVSMTFSDVSGTPFFQTFGHWDIALEQVAEAQAWLAMSVIAGIVAIAAFASQRWSMQPLLLVGAVLTVIPLGMEGHSASGGDHDWGTNSYLWHLVFMSLWIGGLAALLAHSRRLGKHTQLAVSRYSSLALVCAIVMATSGVVNAMLRIGPGDLFTSNYGWIIVAKAVATLILVGLGFLHRQLSIPQLDQRPRVFRRITVVEILVMAATAGIAVTMGRTPPPVPDDPSLSTMEIAVGYEIPFEPTFTNVWTVWRFDVMFSVLGILLAVGYLWAVRKARQRGFSWPILRTIWFLVGSVGLAVVMSSGVGMIIPATFSMHMIGHMLLSMTFPVFMVLGAPLSLIMKAYQPGPYGKPGLHDWVKAFTQSRGLAIVTFPPLNLAQFIVVFYALYLNLDLYQTAISDHAGHVIMNFAFLISGYLYFWEVIGPDPIPNRRPPLVRLAWLTFSMPIHLYLGVYMMQLTDIMGEEFYQALELPWDIDLLADQRAGAGIGWAAGGFPLLLVFGALFKDLFQFDKAEQAASDAADEATVDTEENELARYNAMLDKMGRGEYISDEYHETTMEQSRFRRR